MSTRTELKKPLATMKHSDGREILKPWYHQIAEAVYHVSNRRDLGRIINRFRRLGFQDDQSAAWDFAGWARLYCTRHGEPLRADGLSYCNDSAPRGRTYSAGTWGVQIEWNDCSDKPATVRVWRNRMNPN